jgi:anti-sigma regulatory factor (Ser/Thr protein kinase)
VAAIKARGHGLGEPGVVAARAAPADGAGWRWLMVAAESAGLAGSTIRLSPDPALGPGHPPRIATRVPGTGTGSVRAAREYVLATLERWGVAERREDIAIVISELLTNALRHALPPPGHTRARRAVRLGLLQPGPCVLCAVTDPSEAAPVAQAAGPLAETGRGLHIVCALSDGWGYTTLGDTGKVVWAVFTSRLTPIPPARFKLGTSSHATHRPVTRAAQFSRRAGDG